MSQSALTKWYREHGVRDELVPSLCIGSLSVKDSLFCADRRPSSGLPDGEDWQEVWVRVVRVDRGKLATTFEAMVGLEARTGGSCEIAQELVDESRFGKHGPGDEPPHWGLFAGVGPDGHTIILRPPIQPACNTQPPYVERMKEPAKTKLIEAWTRVCKNVGVYVDAGEMFEKRPGGVASSPNATTPLEGGVLREPCVVPEARELEVGSIREATQSDLDLDGDGTFDMVYYTGAARWQATYALYVKRGSCGHFVGWLATSEWPRRLPTKSHGLYDLLTSDDECPCPNRQVIGTAKMMNFDEGCRHDSQPTPKWWAGSYCDIIWRFDGRVYQRSVSAPAVRIPDGIRP